MPSPSQYRTLCRQLQPLLLHSTQLGLVAVVAAVVAAVVVAVAVGVDLDFSASGSYAP